MVLTTINFRFEPHLRLHFPGNLTVTWSKATIKDNFLPVFAAQPIGLKIEKLWHAKPPIPASSRTCGFCSSGDVGDETHFLMNCHTVRTKRACFVRKISMYPTPPRI